ncbi:MAG TPA: M14 family zinc carboxypeptidase, partial [Pyrinomonadaceae bacterium]|nr:M14 family zinc carboxypeptidase [Pyrinomonadaceae bacterium]
MTLRRLSPALLLSFALLCVPHAAPRHAGARQTNPQRAADPRTPAPAQVPAPEDVLGFRPGDDRRLAGWQSIVEYFRRLDAASDRVKFEELGRTTLGAPFVLAYISAPENLRRLEEFREIQRRLADPRTLGPRPEREAARLVARGKTIVLVTCGVHSTEVGSTLSSTLIAHRLASSNEPDVQEILRNTVVLLVPSLNPDGQVMIVDWYQ